MKKRVQEAHNSTVLVTGACGFIGSHLCEKLLETGYTVTGIDSLSDFYSKDIKLNNINLALQNPRFSFFVRDILSIQSLNEHVEYIFHVAAQPGVRTSWGKNFDIYVRDNVLATQHLLELCKDHKRLKKFIYSSSSSIYGDAKAFPTSEDCLPKPISPYGVTKLAGEHLCQLYHKNFGIPIICLRYFTVFGPRQRPDMAFHKFIKAILENRPITVFGNGNQSRDFTFVIDVVDANIAAMTKETESTIFNIGGGNHETVNGVIGLLQDLLGKKAKINYIENVKGDVRDTKADITLPRRELGFNPAYDLKHGLQKEIEWLKSMYNF